MAFINIFNIDLNPPKGISSAHFYSPEYNFNTIKQILTIWHDTPIILFNLGSQAYVLQSIAFLICRVVYKSLHRLGVPYMYELRCLHKLLEVTTHSFSAISHAPEPAEYTAAL